MVCGGRDSSATAWHVVPNAQGMLAEAHGTRIARLEGGGKRQVGSYGTMLDRSCDITHGGSSSATGTEQCGKAAVHCHDAPASMAESAPSRRILRGLSRGATLRTEPRQTFDF